MSYLLIIILFFVLLLFYFRVADKYNIIDKPNHRSAHTYITLRGGGIVFWFAGLVCFVQYFQETKFFFAGLTIVSLISFWDDIQSLSNKIRLLAHFIAISLVFYDLNLFEFLPFYVVVLAYIFFIGTINAYNFMDGINGITGLYTISVFGSLWYVNKYVVSFVDPDFVIYPVLASIVFLFFNYRKKAKCFAGDIGSIGIAFWIVYTLLMLMLATHSFIWILFLVVYGADAGCTIAHRIYLRENIFEAHRHHYYQILSNNYKIDHRVVSLAYFVLQLLCSFLVIQFYESNQIILFLSIVTVLVMIYLTKFYLLKKLKGKNV
ncbi:MAG: glycosyltransferase family 4 protein [Limnohabitans sp.]|nr:glycosyltransferase family 4 protein [Limnohabitans sp.]